MDLILLDMQYGKSYKVAPSPPIELLIIVPNFCFQRSIKRGELDDKDINCKYRGDYHRL